MNERPKLPSLRGGKAQTIDMVKGLGGFDAEAWHVIERRDNQLIEDEILHGSGSASFVYSFKVKGKEVTGVSVVGARHLAAHYGGMKHRIVASTQKDGELHTFTSYPSEQAGMSASVSIMPELAREPDYYAVVIEVMDLKSGNTLQVEARERRFESRDDGSQWEKPHYQKIAQSKAYRNAVINLIPQDVILKWKLEMLKLQKGEVVTDSVLEQKRKSVLAYTANQGIPLLRHMVNELTMEQIEGLSEAAKTKDRSKFMAALGGLNLIEKEKDVEQEKAPERAEGPQERPTQAGGREEAHGEEGAGKDKKTEEAAPAKRPSLFRRDEE
jgi:hypothetical protein